MAARIAPALGARARQASIARTRNPFQEEGNRVEWLRGWDWMDDHTSSEIATMTEAEINSALMVER